MAEKDFYIMLENAPWAGPNAVTHTGPDFAIDDGVFIADHEQLYEISLTVDKLADNPADFPPCDIHMLDSGYLFSERFIELLNNMSVDNIQYFDAKVIYEPTGLQFPYKAANVIGKVSGLDLDGSVVELSRKGNIIAIRTMKLDENKMQGQKIVRLHESVMLIVVHRSIKEAVENSGLTGFMFVADDEYDPSMI